MIVGLNQERLVFEHVHQQVFCGVDDGFYVFVLQTFKDFLVNIRRHAVGYAACKDYGAAVGKFVKLFKKQVEIFVIDVRALTV